MGKARRRIPVIPVAFGVVFALIVVIAIVLISSVNRQRVEPKERGPGATTASGKAAGMVSDAVPVGPGPGQLMVLAKRIQNGSGGFLLHDAASGKEYPLNSVGHITHF